MTMGEMIDYVETSRDIHLTLRFNYAYLTYLSETVINSPRSGAGGSSTGGSPPGAKKPEKTTMRFREVKDGYMVNADTLPIRSKEAAPQESPGDIIWEVSDNKDEDKGGSPAVSDEVESFRGSLSLGSSPDTIQSPPTVGCGSE